MGYSAPRLNQSADALQPFHTFVTPSSRRMLHVLNIHDVALQYPIECWEKMECMKHAKEFIRAFKVVNDCAERGVSLIQQFNHFGTKDEEQKQYLLQVVAQHRKQHPQAKKSEYM